MNVITPDWPAPQQVKALTTCRKGGVSRAGYASLNVAQHVGDDQHVVTRNRETLVRELELPAPPIWLNQVHGTDVVELDKVNSFSRIQADAVISRNKQSVCAVMTADCLPVLFCKEDGSAVAAAHAGWRGLLAGVLDNTLQQLAEPDRVMAWLGPAIGPSQFEVGAEVREAFVNRKSILQQGFRQVDSDHYFADLYALARMILLDCGVKRIYGGEHCTYNQPNQFYSYRREPITGRMASLIWLQP